MLWLKDQAPHASPRGAFSKNDPQECGGLRQGNIALIHSAPTGEKGVDTVIASEAKQSTGAAKQEWIASSRCSSQ